MSVQNPVVINNNSYVTNQTFTDATVMGAQWDFQGVIGSGSCDDGKFLTNNAETDETTVIWMSGVNTSGTDSRYILSIGVGNFIRFTDIDAHTVVFQITSMVTAEDGSDCMQIGVSIAGGQTPWNGRYTVDFQPGTGS